MSSISRTLGLVTVAVIGLSGSLLAGEAVVQGTVKDANGKLLPNADVKIEQTGGSSWNKHVKTDGQGRYYINGLSGGGTYRVSLLVGGAVKASINNVKTKSGASTDLNFDLKNGKGASTASTGKKKTHMVYMPPETGSNMGGRWVEVDDNASLEAQQTTNVKRAGASAVSSAQGKSGGQIGGN